MNRKHLVFIVNPRSGVERHKTVREAIDKYLDRRQYSFEIRHTGFAGHGTELARVSAAQGAFAVVAVGGDGSVNDIVRGLQGTETALAILPKGSGNGMARTMSIPLGIRQAMEVINSGHVTSMDIGFANDHLFITNACVGFDAVIAHKFASSKRRGFAVYSGLVARHLWQYKERDWEITVDGRQFHERAFMVNVANGKQFGYNFQIAPEADWQDGLLELIVIRKFPKLLGLPIVIRAMNGTLMRSPFVTRLQGREITISHPDMKLMQTDGDAHPCEGIIRCRIAPAAQRVLVPPGG